MSPLPSGTVTFLFTDIEGSTKLAQQYPDKWESLRARHYAILQSAMESYNGYVFQIIGDAFCVAFHTAGGALRATIRAQTELHSENWDSTPIRVRMGIHTGKAEIQPDGQYHGYLAMSRVQRLMSAGHGGQVLISAATQELLLEDLPEEVSLRDLGERRLKDLIRPEQIYQLIIPGLPTESPPLKTLDFYRHNLPIQLTSFIGREKEISEIKQSLMIHRLVTLTGVGGTGKTRLALQVAADLLDQFPHGTWFVEFAPLNQPDLIPQTILAFIGISEQPGLTALQQLDEYLHHKKLLLILDNCEHLLQACAEVVNSLLSHSSTLTIMATSREAFGISGEVIWHVPSLSLPDIKQSTDLEHLSRYEAVQLFIERATLVQPHFQVTKENAPAIAQICFRLDGIPLALELAAARVRTLGVDQINKRLDDRFRLLTGGSRTALERHQTLRATIDWSYNLLSENERILLCRLSVFVGGCDLEAAEQVCAGSNDISSSDVLDLLTHLVDKSLVILEGSRYRMLETTRHYAIEKWKGSGVEESAQNDHLAYFLQLAEEAEGQLIGPDQAQWLNRLEREHDNFRSALRWCMESGKGEEAARIAGALGTFWFKHSHFSEGRRLFANILERDWNISAHAQVKAWRSAGILAFWQGDAVETIRIFTQNLERERALGDQWGIAFSLHELANVAGLEGDVEKERKLQKESIAISRKIEATWVLAMAQIALGYLELRQGNLALAEGLFEESLDYCRRTGEKWGMELILNNLGLLSYSREDFLTAKRNFLESLELARELGDEDGMTTSITGLARIYQGEGRHIASARLQGFTLAKGQEIGTPLQTLEQETYDATAKALKESMGEQAYQNEFETGTTLTLNEALKLISEQN